VSDSFQIASYVSPNLSSEVLIAYGPIEGVAAFAAIIGRIPEATIEAQADDGCIGFLKVHISQIKYIDFIRLMQLRPPNVEIPFVRHAVPSSEHGRVGDVGNPHAEAVIVGILGDADTVERIKEHLDWATMHPLFLGFTGEGVYFEPDEDVFDAYVDFVRDAEAGLYANVSVVLLRRANLNSTVASSLPESDVGT
jgi:hypothetical protein